MKKTYVIILIVLLLFTCLLSSCSQNDMPAEQTTQAAGISAAASQEPAPSEPPEQSQSDGLPLRVGIRNDSPGFAYLNIDTGEINGYEVDLMNEIGAVLGRDIEYTVVNDTTREQELKNGDIDLVIATYTITDGRKSDLVFSRPYYTDKLAFLVPKDSKARSVSDLNAAKVGVADNTTAVDDLNETAKSKGIEVTAVPFETFSDAKKALFANEIDAIYMDESLLRSYQDGRIIEEYFTPQPYGIAALKENAELINAVDGALDLLISDGTAEALADHWELKLDL